MIKFSLGMLVGVVLVIVLIAIIILLNQSQVPNIVIHTYTL